MYYVVETTEEKILSLLRPRHITALCNSQCLYFCSNTHTYTHAPIYIRRLGYVWKVFMNKLEDSPLCQSHHNLHAQRRKKLTCPQLTRTTEKYILPQKITSNQVSKPCCLLPLTTGYFSLPSWLCLPDFALPPLCLCAYPLKSVSLGYTDEQSIWWCGSFTFFKFFIIVIPVSVTMKSWEKEHTSFSHSGNPFIQSLCVLCMC